MSSSLQAVLGRYLSPKWKQFFIGAFSKLIPILHPENRSASSSLALWPASNLRQISKPIQSGSAPIWLISSLTRVKIRRAGCFIASPCERLVRFAREGYIRPRTFLGVGGMKVFVMTYGEGFAFLFKRTTDSTRSKDSTIFPQGCEGRAMNLALML